MDRDHQPIEGQDGPCFAVAHSTPIDELTVFLALCGEACRATPESDHATLNIVVDAATAQRVPELVGLASSAQRVLVLGRAPDAFAEVKNVQSMPADGGNPQHRLLLALCGKDSAVALTGFLNEDSRFVGAWTAHRETVSQWTASAQKYGAEGTLAPAGATSLPYLLMSAHVSALAVRSRDAAKDKHDLVSVLEILKAISSKRRTHDILFVFVEQIARSVEMDRCSIVRIWGSGRYAQVLASHEDASIRDRSIDLDKYPEINHALSNRGKVLIEDVLTNPLTSPFADSLRQSGLQALAVIPIVLFDDNVGSLLLRAARKSRPFNGREVSFFEIVAEAASNALERAHLMESIQLANQRLERLATVDGLTGVFNHRYFRERLRGEIERAIRYQLPLACILMDIDDFKQLNDTYGHLLGDSVLHELAQLTLGKTRKSDLLARYGGEEFAVVMPQTDLEGARIEAERLCDAIAAHNFQGVPPERKITMSVGVAELGRETMVTADDLLHAADHALYDAKRSGKNRVALHRQQGEGK